MARSRIVVVGGQTYLVPRKKYKAARSRFPNTEDTWAYIMENIEDYGRVLEEESEEPELEEAPKKEPKKESKKEPKKESKKEPKKESKKEPKKEPKKAARKKASSKGSEAKKTSTKKQA